MLIPLSIPPGFNTEDSEYVTGPRWINGDNVRFRNGVLEKIGGWELYTDGTFIGVTRAVQGWSDLVGRPKFAFATNKKLYVVYGGTVYDITPIDATGTMAADPFTTTLGSDIVTVVSNNHGRLAGDYVVFENATAVGGITIDGTYTVRSVLDANTFMITHTSAATSAGTGGGASVTYIYYLSNGLEYGIYSYGYGVGPYGGSTWGTPRATSTTELQLRTWSLDNWGEDLVGNPSGGYVYLWDNSAGTASRATKITNAPKCNSILVSPTDRHLIALGAVPNGGTDIDPMLIRWSNQEDYDTWAPAATNTAGSLRLSDGSKIVGALRTRNEILVWTDTAMYSMQFLGPPYTFGVTQIATGCGLIGPNAAIEYGGVVYWLGKACRQFYSYAGRVETIPCPILNHVQDDINLVQAYQVYAGMSKAFSEIHFFYCSEGSTSVDKRATYNYTEKHWTFGNMDRSAWADVGSSGLLVPVAFDMNGNIWQHESGSNADNSALAAYAETGAFELGEGDKMTFFDRLIPDFERVSGTVNFTAYTKRYPNSTEIIKGPYPITASTEKVSLRGRGRQIRFRVESDEVNGDFRLGKMRLNVQPDGER